MGGFVISLQMTLQTIVKEIEEKIETVITELISVNDVLLTQEETDYIAQYKKTIKDKCAYFEKEIREMPKIRL